MVTYDTGATQWVISTGSLDLTVGFGEAGFFEIQRLAVAGKDPVNVPGEPESRLAIGHDERWLQDGKDRPVRFVASRTDGSRGASGSRWCSKTATGERWSPGTASRPGRPIVRRDLDRGGPS